MIGARSAAISGIGFPASVIPLGFILGESYLDEVMELDWRGAFYFRCPVFGVENQG